MWAEGKSGRTGERGLLQQPALRKGFKVQQQELSGRKGRDWKHLLSWRPLWAGSTLRFSRRGTRPPDTLPLSPFVCMSPDMGNEVPCSFHWWLGWGNQGTSSSFLVRGDRAQEPQFSSRSRSPSLVPSPCVPRIPHPFPLSLSGWVSFAPHSALSGASKGRGCSWVSAEDA